MKGCRGFWLLLLPALLALVAPAAAYQLTKPKAFDAEAFARKLEGLIRGRSQFEQRAVRAKYALGLAAAAEPGVTWAWVCVILADTEQVRITAPGALRFAGVPDLGMLVPDDYPGATFRDTAIYPVTLRNDRTDVGVLEHQPGLRLLVRLPLGIKLPAAAEVDTSKWKGVTP